MAPSGEGGDNAPLLADPENEKESVSPQGTKNCEFPDVIHTTTVSVPLPSRSRTSSDGKIKLFSVGRSRSSSSKSSLTSLGSIGTNYWTPAKLYLSDKTVCYRLHSQEQVLISFKSAWLQISDAKAKPSIDFKPTNMEFYSISTNQNFHFSFGLYKNVLFCFCSEV